MARFTFSAHYKLNKFQDELDFVDIPIADDVPLFIDPYVFSVREDLWSAECNNLIVDFFHTVINAIRSKNARYAQTLLSNLNEPTETHLGVSRSSVSGRGIGGKQAFDLYNQLSKSEAAKTGKMADLSDCELLIPGIGFDKVSDITTNIIRKKLIEYTQEQCRLYNIPMRLVPSGRLWNPQRKRWLNGEYVELPVVNGKKIVLVPKFAVVYKPSLSSAEFYEHDILEYIQAEHIKAMSSLVEVLKNGSVRVTKKRVKEQPEYKMTKEFIFDFCSEHPEILENYKKRKRKKAIAVENISEYSESHIAQCLIESLENTPLGTEAASSFHNLSLGIMEFLFFPHLMYPKKEHEVHDGRKRIDITFHNAAADGFFAHLKSSPTTASSLIMMECKNYSTDIGNPELDQMAGRFSHLRGYFGIILCRKFKQKELFLQRCKDTAKDGRGIIMCLDDEDITAFLRHIQQGNRSQIDADLVRLYQAIIS